MLLFYTPSHRAKLRSQLFICFVTKMDTFSTLSQKMVAKLNQLLITPPGVEIEPVVRIKRCRTTLNLFPVQTLNIIFLKSKQLFMLYFQWISAKKKL